MLTIYLEKDGETRPLITDVPEQDEADNLILFLTFEPCAEWDRLFATENDG